MPSNKFLIIENELKNRTVIEIYNDGKEYHNLHGGHGTVNYLNSKNYRFLAEIDMENLTCKKI